MSSTRELVKSSRVRNVQKSNHVTKKTFFPEITLPYGARTGRAANGVLLVVSRLSRALIVLGQMSQRKRDKHKFEFTNNSN